jgi:GNAT superfamily N-acetyltransferase
MARNVPADLSPACCGTVVAAVALAPVSSADTSLHVMSDDLAPSYQQAVHPDEVSHRLRSDLIECWITVSNSGGAVGFPFPPVSGADVEPVAAQMIESLDPQLSRLLFASVDGVLAGWLNVRREAKPVVMHWATVNSVQTHPRFRGRGIGAGLMSLVRHIGREEMGLEQLHLAARAGMGLEDFYSRLGWREVGRWPGALRLGPDDDRDEVLMLLAPL